MHNASGETGVVDVGRFIAQPRLKPIFLEFFVHVQFGPHAANIFFNFSRPRKTFVFTVPSGISSTRDASSWDKPFWQQSTTAERSCNGKSLKRMHEILFQCRIDRARIRFGLELSLIDPDEFLPFAGFFAKAIVGDSIKPGGKFRFATKTANVFVSAQESLLRQIIRCGNIAARKVAQQPAHGRLVIPHQLGKSMVVIIQ